MPSRTQSGPRKSGIDVRALDQRAADRPRLGVAQRDVRAAPRGVARRAERRSRAAPSHSSCSAISSSVWAIDFSRSASMPGLGGDPHALLDRGQHEDRRRAGQEAGDARRGLVRALHRELVVLAEPALDRRAQRVLQRLGDVQVAGGARAGVEVLVGAADGVAGCRRAFSSTGTAPAECERSQIDRAPRSKRLHVGQRAGAVVDVARARRAPSGHARRAAGRAAGRRLEDPQLEPARAGDALEHVAVGREVVLVGDERARATGRRRAAR